MTAIGAISASFVDELDGLLLLTYNSSTAHRAQRLTMTAIDAQLCRPVWAAVDTHHLLIELSASLMTVVGARCAHAELNVSQRRLSELGC